MLQEWVFNAQTSGDDLNAQVGYGNVNFAGPQGDTGSSDPMHSFDSVGGGHPTTGADDDPQIRAEEMRLGRKMTGAEMLAFALSADSLTAYQRRITGLDVPDPNMANYQATRMTGIRNDQPSASNPPAPTVANRHVGVCAVDPNDPMIAGSAAQLVLNQDRANQVEELRRLGKLDYAFANDICYSLDVPAPQQAPAQNAYQQQHVRGQPHYMGANAAHGYAGGYGHNGGIDVQNTFNESLVANREMDLTPAASPLLLEAKRKGLL